MRCQIGSGEYLSQKKSYWSLNVSSEVRKLWQMRKVKTTRGINRCNRVRKWGRGYSRCVHVRTIERNSQKIGHKVFAYKMDEL